MDILTHWIGLESEEESHSYSCNIYAFYLWRKNYSVDDFLRDKDLLHKIIAKCRSGKLYEISDNCSHALRLQI